MGAVLNDEELAQLLKLDEGLIDRLLAETDLPRVAIAGHVRFLTDDVLSWLRTQQSVLPVTESVPITVAPAPPEPQPIPTLRSAGQDEVPFVSRGALSSLGTGRSDPSENLARQQVRDALAAMGDALHTRLVRLSHDRLHPSPAESDRTSPWRLGDGISTIDHITICLLYTSPSPRDKRQSRMPSSA